MAKQIVTYCYCGKLLSFKRQNINIYTNIAEPQMLQVKMILQNTTPCVIPLHEFLEKLKVTERQCYFSLPFLY
jgi:hypothetical protein